MKQRSSRNFFRYIFVVITSVHISCSLSALKPYPNDDLPVYHSQKEIVKQGFTIVPSPFGPISSVYFGYQRNRDHSRNKYRNGNQGVDIIEYKILRKGGGWNWKPFLVFSDDNFDGIVDRLFLDSNLDGALDKIYNISSQGVIINRISFRNFEPWHGQSPKENERISLLSGLNRTSRPAISCIDVRSIFAAGFE